MGIYSALSTAVSGLRAQSFALENISGNIMNSQTTGYKRIETDFIDLIPDAPRKRQAAGSVLAQSRSTNDLGGDVKPADKETFMGISGSGFFVVEPSVGSSDGNTLFGGTNFYTRRGDFEVNKAGFLVNGAGYYLKGLPVDATTGNVSGSVPEVIQLSNNFLPAQPTTRINYTVNLPVKPNTEDYEPGIVGSELLRPSNFMAVAPDTPATVTGGGPVLVGTANAATALTAGDTLTLTAGTGSPVTFEFYSGPGAFTPTTPGNIGIDIQVTPVPVSINTVLANIQTQFRTNGGAFAAGAEVSLVGGHVQVSLGSNTTAPLIVANPDASFSLAAGSANPVRPSLLARVPTISAANDAAFKAQSISGGATTVYASNGSPVDVQLRWAKIDSAESGGVDRWNLFYMSNSGATGTSAMWSRVNQDYTFNGSGGMNPVVEDVQLTGVSIDGIGLGDITIRHGQGGLTQFNSTSGGAGSARNTLSQNGYGAGEFQSVAISDGGRVVASYSNGQQVELAQVVIANFNAANSLKRMDGGVYAQTSESGEASYANGSGIQGSSLEASNTDISEEFTKLIVTQQAYAAGTRIVSAANDMLQESLNMIR